MTPYLPLCQRTVTWQFSCCGTSVLGTRASYTHSLQWRRRAKYDCRAAILRWTAIHLPVHPRAHFQTHSSSDIRVVPYRQLAPLQVVLEVGWKALVLSISRVRSFFDCSLTFVVISSQVVVVVISVHRRRPRCLLQWLATAASW